jgi:hypothetical protein
MHRHLCSHCEAVITLDEGRKCQSEDDHADGLCEACALGQSDTEAGSSPVVSAHGHPIEI